MGRKISDQKINKIISLRKKGRFLKEIAKEVGVSSSTVSNYIYGKRNCTYKKRKDYLIRRGFTPTQYSNFIAKKHGYQSFHYYRQSFFKENGQSEPEYREELAKKNNFSSYFEYRKQRDEIKKRQRFNIYFSNLISERITLLGKTKTGLAKEISVARNTITRYCEGTSLPSIENQKRLLAALELPYSCLEELINDLDLPGVKAEYNHVNS